MAILLGRYPRILHVLEMMSTIYQKFYDKTMEFLLSVPGIKVLIVYYFRFLMQFRLACMDIGERYTLTEIGFINFAVTTVISRLSFGWLIIVLNFILCYLELQASSMARFYRKRPTLLVQHFPDSQDPKRRMHKIKQVVEALSNPVVAASIASAGATAVGWRAIDAWDTAKQENIADKNREAANRRHKENLEAEDRRHKETLEAEEHRALLIAERERTEEYIRHKESLEAEALQRQLDREAEYKRHRETLEAEDRRHLENLETKNQKNRESRLSDIDYSKNTASSTESTNEVVDSTQIVD